MDTVHFSSLLSSEDVPQIKVQRLVMTKINGQWQREKSDDCVVTEAPLQLTIHWRDSEQRQQEYPLTITMRTPGQDESLALGLLLSEAIIEHVGQIKSISHSLVDNKGSQVESNQLDIELIGDIEPKIKQWQRNIASSASCGICGKATLQALELKITNQLNADGQWLSLDTLSKLPERLRAQQELFHHTGALHGAGVFNEQGVLISCSEDVGRHNAVDKVVGELLRSKTVISRHILVVSGRISFELMQKCIRANIPVMVAVGAPSSLAIAMAQRFDMTLVGFCSDNKMNIYHGEWRLNSAR